MPAPSSWPAPIPVIVLTGFLGAGKTTLLNELLADPRFADTAVIVNEFGDVAVDHDLVRVGSREMMVTTTGCLCCTPGSDIRISLFDLMEVRRARKVPPFKRVIVETTGLADPAPVVNQLVRGGMVATSIQHLRVANQFALMGVVCAVDAVFGTLSLDRHFECMKQIAMADRIVITKSDLTRQAGSHDVDELRAILRQINGTAQLIDRHGDHFDLSQVFAPRPYGPETLGEDVEGWLAIEAAGLQEHGAGATMDRHGESLILTRSFIFDDPLDAKDFDGFLSLMRLAAGSRLLRLKGLVALNDDPVRPLVVQAVQHAIHPPVRLDRWPSEDRRSRIVAITTGIEREVLDSFFEVLRPRTQKSMAARLGAWTKRFAPASSQFLV